MPRCDGRSLHRGRGERTSHLWRTTRTKLLGLAPSTISAHLSKLLNLYLLSARKEGSTIYYRLRNHQFVYAFYMIQ